MFELWIMIQRYCNDNVYENYVKEFSPKFDCLVIFQGLL